MELLRDAAVIILLLTTCLSGRSESATTPQIPTAAMVARKAFPKGTSAESASETPTSKPSHVTESDGSSKPTESTTATAVSGAGTTESAVANLTTTASPVKPSTTSPFHLLSSDSTAHPLSSDSTVHPALSTPKPTPATTVHSVTTTLSGITKNASEVPASTIISVNVSTTPPTTTTTSKRLPVTSSPGKSSSTTTSKNVSTVVVKSGYTGGEMFAGIVGGGVLGTLLCLVAVYVKRRYFTPAAQMRFRAFDNPTHDQEL